MAKDAPPTADADQDLRGLRKAAILLLSMDPETSSKVL